MRNKLKVNPPAGGEKLKVKLLRKRFVKIIGLLFFLLVLAVFLKNLKESLFFQKKDRINFVFYGKETVYYSLGLTDKVNYVLYFYPDLKINVPGGYGYYRIGALSKLISLEKKPDILRKAFSNATFSLVNYYFYPPKTEVYYGKNPRITRGSSFYLPGARQLFFYYSNANIFNKSYLLLRLIGKRKNEFIEIDSKTENISSDNFFSGSEFQKKYQGFFYQKTYRDEKLNVQIIYTKNYKTALLISQLIEGEGIRTVDLTQADRIILNKKCQVVENKNKFSETAKDLSRFFNCELKKDKTELSDIILKLGDIEREWEIN